MQISEKKQLTYKEVTVSMLRESSSVFCIFTEEVSKEVVSVLKRTNVKDKILLLILHRKGDEKRMRKECKQIQAIFKLEKHQIIRKSAEDGNFNATFEQLKRSIDGILTNTMQRTSVSKLTAEVKEGPTLKWMTGTATMGNLRQTAF